MSQENNMTLWEHVGELRRRLIYILAVFVISIIVGFFFAEYVIQYLQSQPIAETVFMAVFAITDAFKVYLQFSIVVAVVITFPYALYQIWAFVSPGLTSKEKKITLSFIPGSIVLFLTGLAFGYFWIFPLVFQFMVNIAERLGAEQLFGMVQYFSFLFTLVVPFGFLFQMPILILFLTRLGIITPMLLRKMRKFAYFGLFVIAAFITPPELFSHLVVTVPLILLYEISVWFAHIVYKREQKRKKELEIID